MPTRRNRCRRPDPETVGISIRDLSLRYGDAAVLDALDLDVHDGEFIVLLGSSGCGKSTLLNCIAGLLDVSDGQVFIKGRNVTWEEPANRGIGMVFQSYALYPRMSVRGNLSFGLKHARVPKAEIAERVRRTAEILQIESLLDRKPAQLSGGQRQRVAIGRALARDVDVFLFDEPLSNLDAKLRSELRVEIKRLHQRLGNTMVYVTHDQVEAMTLADRIAIMKGGAVQQLDTPAAIYGRPVNRYVAGFIGSPAMNFLAGRIEGDRFVASGIELPLDGHVFADPAAARGACELGIRPEHVLSGDAAHGAPFRAEVVVEVVEPMGSDTQVWTRLGGQELRLRVDGQSAIRPNDRLLVGIDAARASLFSTDGDGPRL